MKVKRCCVTNCESASNNEQHRGVTFQKFPKHKDTREQWFIATRCRQDIEVTQYVCSRHFYKVDFETYPDSKYALRAGAVPSIFPWESILKRNDEILAVTSLNAIKMEDMKEITTTCAVIVDDNSPETKIKTTGKPKCAENVMETVIGEVDDFTTKIETVIGEVDDFTTKIETVIGEIDNFTTKIEPTVHSFMQKAQPNSSKKLLQNKSIIGVIHSADASESEAIYTENVASELLSQIPTPSRRGRKSKMKNVRNPYLGSDEKEDSNSAFSVGKQIEAKDFGDVWHPARIVEVDSDEIEVLVHYDNWSQRHDEWISMSSPRIRSLSTLTASPSQSGGETKAPVIYKVGERCLARWTNNRRFPATVRSVVGNGKYEMIFDDGYILICPWYSLSKMKTKKSALTAANSSLSLEPSSSRKRSGPSLLPPEPQLSLVPFHRHLFDPSRDYLGPKSERREMKRKLDVKALFNIGRRNSTHTNSLKRKKPTPAEEVPPAKKKKVGKKEKKYIDHKSDLVGEVETKAQKSKKKIKLAPKDGIKEEQENVLINNPELNEKMKPVNDIVLKKEVKFDDVPITFSSVIEPEKVITVKHDIKVNENIESEKTDALDICPLKEEIISMNVKETKIDILALTTNTNNIMPKEMEVDSNKANLIENNSKNDCNPDCASVVKEDVGVTSSTENIGTENSNPELHTAASIIPSVIKGTDGTLQIVVHPLLPEQTNTATNALPQNVPVEDDNNYVMDIDEGLKLIAEAVESFSRNTEADFSLKSKAEESNHKLKEPTKKDLPSADEYSEAFLEEGKWCCRWVNGEPQGVLSDVDSELSVKGNNVLPRKSVLVEDKRLPPGWQKVLVRRSSGSSAGKWDIVLIEPNGRRLRDKGEMRNYLSMSKSEDLMMYENVLMDFSVHRKLSRQMGWDIITSDGLSSLATVGPQSGASVTSGPSAVTSPTTTPPAPTASGTPFGRRALSLKKKASIHKVSSEGQPSKKKKKNKVPEASLDLNATMQSCYIATPVSSQNAETQLFPIDPMAGFVYVGSMKVEIIENLYRCPADKCFKNFRNDNLLRMHIKHYHRELRKLLGSTPKVSDLAYARTAIPEGTVVPKLKCEGENKAIKPKFGSKSVEKVEHKDNASVELYVDTTLDSPSTPIKRESGQSQSSLQDSPKLRSVLENPLPPKRPKILYPVKKMEMPTDSSSLSEDKLNRSHTPEVKPQVDMEAILRIHKLPDNQKPIKAEPAFENLDFETAISSHTVTKPVFWNHKPKKSKKSKSLTSASLKTDKKKGKNTVLLPQLSDVETWDASDLETMSSYGTPDSHGTDRKPDVFPELETPLPVQKQENEDPSFLISETGERIKIVRMKREEIINCHCGFCEEDGLMIQCELCLCWQHALCHNIQTESQVPDKYTCSICLNPRRGRRSRRFLHDQTWLYEGALPGGTPDPALRRSHELTANLLRLSQVLHTLRLKFHIAEKKDHPKLYLWAKDWEGGAAEGAGGCGGARAVAEALPHVDLRDMFGEIGKENLPLKEEDMKDVSLGDIRPTLSEEVGDSQKDDSQLGSLANLLSSPGGPTLDLPISTSELERLAKSVQESEVGRSTGPEPEAAIESSTCRKNLLKHILRCQLLIDARLDSIEAQVAELESQEPSFEDDETAEFFPRTKQTIQMLHRDLGTLEELGLIT